jgi:hypothetical protein
VYSLPSEAHTSVVGFASEGSALRSMWRSHGPQPMAAPLPRFQLEFNLLDLLTILELALLRRKPRSLRPWMDAWRVPYEAHTSVVGYASEGSTLQSMGRSHGLSPWGAPHCRNRSL